MSNAHSLTEGTACCVSNVHSLTEGTASAVV